MQHRLLRPSFLSRLHRHVSIQFGRQRRSLTTAAQPDPTIDSDEQLHREQLIKLRSCLRSLLREARQLPDPASREYVKKHALSRYRTHHEARVPSTRQRTRLHSIKRDVNALRKANQGYLPQNLKVLMLTYGRAGSRRHELLQILVEDDPEANAKAMTDRTSNPILKGLPGLHPENVHKIPVPTVQHVALMRDQMQRLKGILETRQLIRRLSPEVPELNNWKRPMPQKRLVNFARAHWRMLLERTLPPLEAAEWERLRQLATREATPELTTLRANGATSMMKRVKPEGDESHLELALAHPTKFAQRINEDKVSEAGGRTKPHRVTRRVMRRLWTHVFEMCPKMEFDAERKVWRTTWGLDALKKLRRSRNDIASFPPLQPDHLLEKSPKRY